jgi:hypothetical protein
MKEDTVFEFMMEQYNAAAVPLRERQGRNTERAERRKEIADELVIIRAKDRLSDRLIDEAIVTGTGNAEALRQEQARLRQGIGTLEGESETLSVEITRENEELEQVFKALAARVLKENFPAIREKTIAKVQECLEYLDAAWSDLQGYERNTAPCLNTTNHRDRLIPKEFFSSADEAKLYRRVQAWFGGRIINQ